MNNSYAMRVARDLTFGMDTVRRSVIMETVSNTDYTHEQQVRVYAHVQRTVHMFTPDEDVNVDGDELILMSA